MSEVIEIVLFVVENANQVVKAGTSELEVVNELEISYTECHELIVGVGDPVYLAAAYLVVNLQGFLDDQMTVVAPDSGSYMSYASP